jgi:RHS repeat-associated protein
MGFMFSEVNDSQIWVPVTSGSTTSWMPVVNAAGSATWGWQTVSPNGSLSSTTVTTSSCGSTNSTTTNNYVYTDVQGTAHKFPSVVSNFNCSTGMTTGTLTGYASDNSGYFVNTTTGQVLSPRGVMYMNTGNVVKDTNGNYITATVQSSSVTSWADTSGTTALTATTYSTGTVTYADPNNDDVTVTMETLNIKTNFGCSGVAEYTGSATVPETITLPNGQTYAFAYEQTPGNSGYYTGRLAQVTYPFPAPQYGLSLTPATIQYAYTGSNDGINCADGTTLGMTRTISPGSSSTPFTGGGFSQQSQPSGEWTFSRTGSSGSYSTTVTAPQLSYNSAGNQAAYTFDSNGHELTRKIYQGTAGGTPLRTINTTWTSNGTPATSVTILDDNSTQSEIATTYDQTNQTGNLQSMTEYNFGSGAPGSPLRQTSYIYYAFDSSNPNASQYASRNIVNIADQVTIQGYPNGSAAVQSLTKIAYDGSTISSCPTGVAQHDDTNYGCSFVYRGNPTSVTTYGAPASNGQPITRNSTYDVFGNMLTSQPNCCQLQTSVFSATTGYSFPDTVTIGSGSTHLTTTYTYNSAGQVLTATDANGLKTTYAYSTPSGLTSGAGPLTSITRPDGSVISYSYNGVQSTSTSTPITSNTYLSTTTSSDGLGQPTFTSNLTNAVQYDYDPLGRPTATSNPYSISLAEPAYFTTTQFDALGRPIATILPDGEQTTYGYSAQTVTMTDPTGKLLKGKSDGAGRLIEVDEPGGTGSTATSATGTATVNVAYTGSVAITGTEQTNSSVTLAIAGHDAKGATGSGTTIADPIASHSSSKVLLLALVAGSGSGNTVTGISGGGTWTLVRRTNAQSGTAEVWESYTTILSSTTVTATFASTNSLRMLAIFTITGADANSIGATASASSSDGAPSVSLVTTRNNSWVFGVGNDPTHDAGRTVGSGQTSPDGNGESGVGTLWDQRENSTTASSGTQVTLNDTSPSTDAYDFTAVEVLPASFDDGTVEIAAGGHTDTVNYGQGSTPSTLATALANAINGDSSAVVYGGTSTSSPGTVFLTARAAGDQSSITYSGAASSGNPNISSQSFTFNPSQFSGAPGILSPANADDNDSGTAFVTVNNVQSQVSYSPGDTPTTVATRIASAVNSTSSSSLVTATSSGPTVVLTANTAGTGVNYSLSSGSQSNTFPSPAFSIVLSGSTLAGATNGGGPTMSASVATTYTYDALDDLTGVTEGSQTRTYAYDGLGRLTSSAVPETGNIATQFVYDNFNNLTQRTDPRGVVTSYSYDGLNRLTQISYNVGSTGVPATPTVNYYYDAGGASAFALGKLTSMSDGPGTDTYTYDNMGRRTQCVRVINSVAYTTSYNYNEMNEVTQTTYPSGRVVQQSFDSLARLCEVAPSTTGCGTAASPYSTGYAYSAANQVSGFNYGNGVSASFASSPDRLQLTSLAYAKGTSTLFSQNYDYVQNGGNNGQIAAITDNVDNGRTAYYGYDALLRLVSAATVGSANYSKWGLSWNYDRYGNRTAQNVTAGSAPSNSVSVSATTNQFTTAGYAYDAAGNMTNDGVNSLVYDAEDRVTSSSGGGGSGVYTYDGYSKRIEKSVSGVATAYIFSNSQVIAEYAAGAAASSPSREYIYGGSALLANIASSTTQYYHQDHLSNRLMTDSSGNVLGQQGHFPFGEQWYASNTTTKWFFTTYERDAESGNDYAMARYYINRLGRFNTLDPAGLGSVDISNPQTWNAYTYVLNDPINLVDPTGLDCAYLNDAGDAVEDYEVGEGEGVCVNTGGYYFSQTIDPFDLNFDDNSNWVWDPGTNSYACAGDACGMDSLNAFVASGPGTASVNCDLSCQAQNATQQNYLNNVQQVQRTPTPQDYLRTINLAGMEADHDLGCAIKAMAGMVPFAGHLIQNPKTSLDTANTVLGGAGEAQIILSQSDKISTTVSAMEMPNIGELVATYGPQAESLLGKTGTIATPVAAATAIMQANACFNQHP